MYAVLLGLLFQIDKIMAYVLLGLTPINLAVRTNRLASP